MDNLREEEQLEMDRDHGSGTLSTEEAFELYLEMLARCTFPDLFFVGAVLGHITDNNLLHLMKLYRAHVEPGFVTELFRHPQRRENRKYVKARDVIEREICTVRESVFASMAWTRDFYDEMTTRGFYRFTILGDVEHREAFCGACGRSKHIPSVNICIYGEEYNANRLWTAGR